MHSLIKRQRTSLDSFVSSSSPFKHIDFISSLPNEILKLISLSGLSDIDNNSLFRCSKDLYSRIELVTYRKFYSIITIRNRPGIFTSCLIRENSEISLLPKTIDAIMFSPDFNQTFKLPSTIRILCLGRDFNQSIDGILPNNLQEITFGSRFNKPVTCLKDTFLRVIRFGEDFNNEISGLLPSSLRILKLGNSFNKPIPSVLPSKLITITFGDAFNQNVKHCFHHNITSITFGKRFNRRVKEYLPNRLRELVFGDSFDKELGTRKMSHLWKLKFGKEFKQPLQPCFTSSLKELTLSNAYVSPLKGCLPDSIIRLNVGNAIDFHIPGVIPKNVNFLTIGKINTLVDINFIPKKVFMLEFTETMGEHIPILDIIPPSVRRLSFAPSFQGSIKDLIPPSVEHVICGNGSPTPMLPMYSNNKRNFPLITFAYVPSSKPRFERCIQLEEEDCIPETVKTIFIRMEYRMDDFVNYEKNIDIRKRNLRNLVLCNGLFNTYNKS